MVIRPLWVLVRQSLEDAAIRIGWRRQPATNWASDVYFICLNLLQEQANTPGGAARDPRKPPPRLVERFSPGTPPAALQYLRVAFVILPRLLKRNLTSTRTNSSVCRRNRGLFRCRICNKGAEGCLFPTALRGRPSSAKFKSITVMLVRRFRGVTPASHRSATFF